MRRRPLDERTEIDAGRLAADVNADVVIGHVRSATVGALRAENTHPFRYRQWLYAQTGTVPYPETMRERVLGSLPEFLRGDIRGDTDAELLFHVFLSFLHDGGRLNQMEVEPERVAEALRASIAVVDGVAATALNLMVTDGEHLVAVHTNDVMRFRVYSGKPDAELFLGDESNPRLRAPDASRMHFTLLASDFDDTPPNSRWKVVPPRSVITLERGVDPTIESL
jgi:glutamine amidotransferase